jgi:phenylalanyl-tRNA synthetase beta chain
MGFVHELHEHEDAHPPTIESSARRRVERRLRDALADQGLQEVVNYSFMARADLDRLGLPDDDRRREVREVANPLVREQALMRTTLVPGLLATLKHNLDQHLRDVALFEIGRCYLPEAERRSLVIAVEGRAVRHWSDDRSWDFYDLKGIVEALGTGRELGGPRWSEPDEAVPYLHPGVQAIWGAEEGAPLAHVGQLHPEIAREFDLEVDVLLAEIELEELLDAPDDAASYRALSRYPAITRDYAFVVDDDTSWGQMHAEIEALADEDQAFGALSESVALFDVYEGEQIPEGSRSLAIEIRYRADDRTLTDGEIARLDEALVARLEDRLGARQR